MQERGIRAGIIRITFSKSTFSDVTLKRPLCWTTGAFAFSSSSSLFAERIIKLTKSADITLPEYESKWSKSNHINRIKIQDKKNSKKFLALPDDLDALEETSESTSSAACVTVAALKLAVFWYRYCNLSLKIPLYLSD